jgi:hypothetical protein
VVEHLPSKHEALSSIPSVPKNKKQNKQKKNVLLGRLAPARRKLLEGRSVFRKKPS